MKALVYDRNGLMKMVTDFALPRISSGNITCRPLSVGLNPIDFKIPKLPGMNFMKINSPVGVEFCGEITASTVDNLKIGDLVYGGAMNGALSEQIITSADAVTRLPSNLDPKRAGCFLAVSLTALQGLRLGRIETAKRILIIGASGGVGHMAVQLAKILAPKNAEILAVSSTKNANFVESLGATRAIPYDAPGGVDWATALHGPVDLVFDCVSNPKFDYRPLIAPFCPSGKYVATTTANNSEWLRVVARLVTAGHLPWLENPHYHLMTMKFNNPKDLQFLSGLFARHEIRVEIAKILPFEGERIIEAYQELQTGRVKGKIVVQFQT